MMHTLDSTSSAQGIFNSAPVGCAIISTDNSTFLNVNDQFCRLSGYDKDEIVGCALDDLNLFVQNGSDQSFHELMQRQQSFQNVPVRMRRQSGDWRELMSSGELLSNGETSHLLGMFVDRTREKQLLRRLLETRQEERRRIGEDLNQWLAQMLTGIELLSVSLTNELAEQNSPLTSTARQLNEYIHEAHSFTREVTETVLPVEIDSEGLPPALRRLSRAAEQRHNIDCTFTAEGTVAVPDHTVATTLYEIAKEAITYAVKWGEVSTIELALSTDSKHAYLTIADESTNRAGSWTQHSDARDALDLLRFHVSLLNGTLHINRSMNKRPRISCTVPQSGPPRPPDISPAHQ